MRWTYWMWGVLAVALALLPLWPGAVDSYAFSFLFFVFVYAILAQAWNLIAGFGGQISLGSHAFFGLGAYATAILWSGNYLWGSLYDSHPRIYYFDPVTMALSGLVAAVAAALVGLPLLSKLRGDIVKVLFINGGTFTGGAFGIVAPASTFETLLPHYWTGLGLTVAVAVGMRLLMRSRYGLALIAVRDDEMAASANGIDTLKVKIAAFAGSAFISGVAGSLFTYYLFHVGPDSVFDLNWMLLPLMMTVVGGTGTVMGPIVGAFIMYAVFDAARILVPDYHPVVSGVAIILAMLFLPKGLTRLSFGLPGLMRRG